MKFELIKKCVAYINQIFFGKRKTFGEGKAPVGRPGPCTPWGKPALGLKTRKKNKQSNKLIVRRRDGRAIK